MTPATPRRKIDDLLERLEPWVNWSEFELHAMLRDLDALPLHGAALHERHLARGLILGRLGDEPQTRANPRVARVFTEQAMDSFEAALRVGLDSWQIHWNVGVAALRLGDFSLAARSLTDASEREDAPLPLVLGHLSIVYACVGAWSVAREIFDQARNSAKDPLDWMRLATVASTIGEHAECLGLAALAAGLPGDPVATAGTILATGGLPDEFRQALEASLGQVTATVVAPPAPGPDDAPAQSLAVLDAFSGPRGRANAAALHYDES